MEQRYQMIAKRLLAEIEAGAFGAGAALPTRTELASRFHVARATMDRAVACLVRKGVLAARRGAGTVVTARGPVRTVALIGSDRTVLRPPRQPSGVTVQRLGFESLRTKSARRALRHFDGLIWSYPEDRELEWARETPTDQPQLLVNRHIEEFNYVSTDHRGAIRDITARRLAACPKGTPVFLSAAHGDGLVPAGANNGLLACHIWDVQSLRGLRGVPDVRRRSPGAAGRPEMATRRAGRFVEKSGQHSNVTQKTSLAGQDMTAISHGNPGGRAPGRDNPSAGSSTMVRHRLLSLPTDSHRPSARPTGRYLRPTALVWGMREDGFVDACRTARRFYEILALPDDFDGRIALLEARFPAPLERPLILVSGSRVNTGAVIAWAKARGFAWKKDLFYSDFDNESPPEVWGLTVTSFIQDDASLAGKAMEQILDLITGARHEVKQLIPPRFITGDT